MCIRLLILFVCGRYSAIFVAFRLFSLKHRIIIGMIWNWINVSMWTVCVTTANKQILFDWKNTLNSHHFLQSFCTWIRLVQGDVADLLWLLWAFPTHTALTRVSNVISGSPWELQLIVCRSSLIKLFQRYQVNDGGYGFDTFLGRL